MEVIIARTKEVDRWVAQIRRTANIKISNLGNSYSILFKQLNYETTKIQRDALQRFGGMVSSY